MLNELANILFGATAALNPTPPPPPPPPPAEIEMVSSLELTVDVIDGETVFDLDSDEIIYEDEDGWDCRTMGNRRCGTFGPNGEDWWYEYDELGETIVDEGPVNPAPAVDPWDELEERDDVIVVRTDEIANELVATCLQLDGTEVHVNAEGLAVGHWQSCYPVGQSAVDGFGLD
jgi:hypothetical protein